MSRGVLLAAAAALALYACSVAYDWRCTDHGRHGIPVDLRRARG